MVIGLVNIFMPFMVLPLMAAIERIPPSLEEAARNLGANWWQTFRRTILPLSMPGLISGCLLVYSVSISAFVTPALMGSPRERMVGQQIYDEVLVSFNWPSASALALTLVLLTLLMLFGALFATRRLGRFERAAAGAPAMSGRTLLAAAAVRRRWSMSGCWRRWWSSSRCRSARAPNFEFPPSGLTLRWFAAFFASEPFVTSLFRVSLVVGCWRRRSRR